MQWLVFSYSLSSQSKSSFRVTLWRRLRRIGAISVKTGIYVLPATEDCQEAFQWLTQEVQQVGGEALVIHVEQFEGLTNEQLIEHFRVSREADYLKIATQAEKLEKTIKTDSNEDLANKFPEKLAKLRKHYTEVLRLDFFDCPAAQTVGIQLRRIEQLLRNPTANPSKSLIIAEYRDKQWVTRPRPFVDRLACIWLIRHFINPNAIIHYKLDTEPHEITFDMKEATFGHQGNLCSFETMIHRFGITEPSVQAIAEIVHELDLRDGRYPRAETEGIEAIVRGWLLAGFSDQELEDRGYYLFEGLYFTFSRSPVE